MLVSMERMRGRNTLLVAWCVVLFALGTSGCVSYSTPHTARSVPPDREQLTVASGALGTISDGTTIDGAIPTIAEVQYREGISDNLDIGITGYVLGIMLDVNWTFIDSQLFAASLNPALGGFAGFDDDDQSALLWGGGWVSLLIDLGPPRPVTLTVGPKVGFVAFAGSSSPADDSPASEAFGSLPVGATAALRVHVSERTAIAPEVSVYRISDDLLLYNATIGVTVAQ